MTPLIRWNDDRLDDLAIDVRHQRERLDDFDSFKVQLAELRRDVGTATQAANRCNKGLEALKEDLADEREQQHIERKADRRYLIGVSLTTAGLIIAALAIFLG